MNNEIITSINVNKLFNQFSYNIDFQNNNISILIGPNGTGKTTIMDFLSFVFVPTPKVLKKILSIPFESFGFDLSNGWNITFNKKKNNSEDALLPNNVVLSITTSNQPKIIDFEEIANSNKQQVLSFERGDNERPYNDRAYLNSKSWASDGITVNYERLTKLIADEITLATDKYLPDIDSFQFIRANRFEQYSATDNPTPYSRRRRIEPQTPLEKIDLEIREMCIQHTREYSSRLIDASNALPQLYLNDDEHTEDMSYEVYKDRLEAYQTKVTQYSEIGLIDNSNRPQKTIWAFKDCFKKTGPANLRVNETMFNEKKAFLITYLKAFEVTLGFFDTTYEKLRLFIDIFNKRNEITKKSMRCTSDGLVVDANGSTLSIYDLSSGEKNDIIMFYELIFGTGNIVFIDEPEISLHIEWQADFLNQLVNICKKNDIQIIVATHSPYIVSGHDDLIAEKQVIANE